MDAVAGLMLERQRYEDWIATLEAKRAVTPPHVFDRVRSDYVTRLDAVTAQLKGRTVELKEAIANATARLADVQSRERALTDERHEAELRAAVGEYTAEQWEKVATKSDVEIDRLAADRKRTTEEIGRLQQILSMAGGPSDSRPSGTPAGGAKQVSGSGGDDKGADSRPASSESSPRSRSSSEQPRPSFDELAFLQSVTGQKGEAARAKTEAQAPAPKPEPPPPPPAEPEPRRRAPSENISAVSDSTHDEATESPTAPPLGEDADDRRPSRHQERQPISRDTGPVSSILRDVPQEHVKTLKCAECRAMNYPTEWYCERCGAELAAM